MKNLILIILTAIFISGCSELGKEAYESDYGHICHDKKKQEEFVLSCVQGATSARDGEDLVEECYATSKRLFCEFQITGYYKTCIQVNENGRCIDWKVQKVNEKRI